MEISSILIKDTTKEERIRIVQEELNEEYRSNSGLLK